MPIVTRGIKSSAVTTAKIAAGAVTNAKMTDSSSHYIFAAGTQTTAGGDAAETITVANAAATDICLCTLETEGSTPVTLDAAASAAGQINVTMSGDPSTDHIISYCLLRAVT